MKVLKKGGIYVWRNINLNKSRLLLFFVLLFLSFLLFIMNEFPYASMGVILIPISYGLGLYTYQKYLTWRVGSTSSSLVSEALSNLPDSYSLISGVVIPPNRGDTDHIILAPPGIFVIEDKHYGGEIKCNGDKWKRYKIGRRGSRYDLWVGSPSNQVKRNAKVLKDFILEHQGEIFKERKAPHIWIESIILFTNEKANVSLKKPTVQILSLEEVSDFIENANLEYSLSEQEIDGLGKVILRYST